MVEESEVSMDELFNTMFHELLMFLIACTVLINVQQKMHNCHITRFQNSIPLLASMVKTNKSSQDNFNIKVM